jgi:two-component system OmpR family sensor kinase
VLARSDRGRLALRIEEVPAANILETTRRRFSARAAAAGRAIEVAPGALRIHADRPRIEQALTNLVDNAFRYGDGDLALAAERRDGGVELHVRDGGAGFPANFLPHAFERFARADQARSRGGTGLGLAIVAAIAHAHGGTAGARNKPSGGADVWIGLPA